MPSKKSKRKGRKKLTRWQRLRQHVRLPSWKTALKAASMGIIGFVAVSVIWVMILRFVPAPGTMLMVMRSIDGTEISHDWVPLKEVSPDLVRAVIAAEDTKFCSHHGFDVEQIRAAIEDAKSGDRLRGASTISQQTAKNVFLWPGRGFVRKGLEAWFTVLIETLWPKTRIMEMYVNVAEWGDGYFGAEAAAYGRFSTSAENLTPYEASLMAGVLPNPHKWRVDPPGPYVRQRAGSLRARMAVVQRDDLDACVLKG
ncbi:MAG: monofunctional biosynthetic peptidoglycan transglycosylase [Pseudomonadota bacterium]